MRLTSKIASAIAAFPSLVLAQEGDRQNPLDAIDLPPFALVADRLISPTDSAQGESAHWIRYDQIGSLRLDTGLDFSENLVQYPGVAAYRTTPSRIAHPTTQGMTMRNIGANASSRALVTRDGIPQNDPFGGWIYWHRYPSLAIAATSVNPSGGGETWGNLGSGGVISMVSRQPEFPSGRLSLVAGENQTFGASLAYTAQVSQRDWIDLTARRFETDGSYTLHPDQRGAVDKRAASEADVYSARYRTQRGDWDLSFGGDWFEEERENGTPLNRNQTDAYDLYGSASRSIAQSGARLTGSAYYQNRDFANVFTAVADDRNSERPALDQFDVPAKATGASLSYYLPQSDGGFLLVGADFRRADGQVNERFRNLGNGFTRQRAAGGVQTFAGAFATWKQSPDANNEFTYSARIERAQTSEGFRREINLETDAVYLDQSFADQTDTELSADLAWRHRFDESTSLRLKAFTGFRTPTLNELYRPFRVKNDITEANPKLANERLYGFDASLRFNPTPNTRFDLSAFYYKADDLVANTVLSTESGFDPLCGFVPEGGSCGQRLNIDHSEIAGLEFAYDQRLSDQWNLALNYTLAATRIDSFGTLPSVAGSDLPQSPQSRGLARIDFRPAPEWAFWARIRAWSHAFEDLENQRRISGGQQFDIAARYAIDEQRALSLRVDNLFDRRNQSGLSSSGLISLSPGRVAWLAWDQAF